MTESIKIRYRRLNICNLCRCFRAARCVIVPAEGGQQWRSPERGDIPLSEMIVHIRNAVNVKASGNIINNTRNNDALYTGREF